ncbi:uncharacterized protein LOC143628143 [Bidens hawaiensis]|uniref:uncharacterized protein LOC143628143 n=1 Tax=Bidens hawaiensis TaxID=980011 RepID=UPI0040492E67
MDENHEAISAFLGEEEDDDYEDLYNDVNVNVGEGFLHSVRKNDQEDLGLNKNEVDNKLELVPPRLIASLRLDLNYLKLKLKLSLIITIQGIRVMVMLTGGSGGNGGGTILFVGDLHWWTTDADLESQLCKYGHVKEIKFFDEKASGKSKGYCQVEFYDPAAATACKEGMNAHVFNGRPCVVAFASPYSVKRMGEAQVNKNQQLTQAKRGPGDPPGGNNMPAGGDNNRGYGRGNWGRGNAQGMGGRGMGRGGRGMNGYGPQFGGPMGFDPSFGGRMGGYGAFPGGPTPPFSGMMPSFPPVGNVGLPGLAPHVNPAFFSRGMGMMPGGRVDGPNMGMWSDSNMPEWTGDEHGGRGESSYGEEAGSDQQCGEKDRDRDPGYERDLPRDKDVVHENEWPERRHRSRDRDRDRVRERSWDRGRDRHREERDRYADHHRYREVEPEYDDEWDRDQGRSSRTHGKARLDHEDEHRSRARDADYGKRRRVTAE